MSVLGYLWFRHERVKCRCSCEITQEDEDVCTGVSLV